VIELVAPADADEIDLHDCVDEAKGIRYIGKARRVFGDRWRCLAAVGGQALCLVEITVRPTVVIDQDGGDEDDAGRKRQQLECNLPPSWGPL
jgi:hypothetical protein